ncbi:MAG: hypothetical protein HYR68_08500, partial [Burkholderiales bacterium]|nr:hypothetical protein [Burkholderiales bacterium]
MNIQDKTVISAHELLAPDSHGNSSVKYILLALCLVAALLVPVVVKDPSHQNLAILILMAAQLGV